MPQRVTPEEYALLRSFSERGDKVASAVVKMFDQTYWAELTAAAESANVIRISGQIKDADGQKKAAVADVLLTSKPIAGVGTMTVVAAQGTSKSGSATTSLWLQSKSDGSFQVDVLNATAEDNLIVANVDNGETEMLKLVFA